MTDAEIAGGYEHETGSLIAATIEALGVEPLAMPAALVASHGPFCWGRDAADAVATAIALEAVAAMAHRTLALAPDMKPISDGLLRRHHERKHGPKATYGQPGEPE
jgi:L-ribulose-5-phosphate 4-epimerase